MPPIQLQSLWDALDDAGSSEEEVFIDLFCGGGGASEGIRMATGKSPLLAVNHDPAAIAMHQANHPDTIHFCKNVWDVDPAQEVVKRGVKVAGLWASVSCDHHSRARGGKPMDRGIRDVGWVVVKWARIARPRTIKVENVPEYCFPEEVPVLTKRGLVPIGEIVVGDEVWTHNARWKPVTHVKTSRKSTVLVKGVGNTVMETTPDHRFYAREVAPKITQSGKAGRHNLRLLEPTWVAAQELGRSSEGSTYDLKYGGYAWATPKEMPQYWTRLPKKLGVDLATEAFFYLLGQWVGNGWITRNRNRLVVRTCTPRYKEAGLVKAMQTSGLNWRLNETRPSENGPDKDLSVWELDTSGSQVLVPWLRRHFGEKAEGKTLPAWLLRAPEHLRKAFLSGYLEADGLFNPGDMQHCVTVSRCLAVGIKLLVQSLGLVASLSQASEGGECLIEGRSCQTQRAYSVTWRPEPEWTKFHDSELHYWSRVREVLPGREEVTVVDITVADDHSFVADGQVVHNCDWGPLHPSDHPNPKLRDRPIKGREGETFRKWLAALEALGYVVDWRVLKSSHYGAPTTRERFFLIARCDGRPIVWPEPSHGADEDLADVRTSAECIDWSLPMLSVFADKQAAKVWARMLRQKGHTLGTPKRPLADNTMARIAKGLERYVVDTPNPYIVRIGQTGGGGSYCYSTDTPLTTIVSKAEHLLLKPHLVGAGLINTRNGERKGQEPRTRDLRRPLNTITAQGSQGAVFAAHLAQHNRGAVGREIEAPMSTVAGNINKALVGTFLCKYYGEGGQWSGLGEPMHTLTGKARMSLVAARFGVGDHADEVAKLLGRKGPVTVTVNGEEMVIMDVTMRMLKHHELALAQGFPEHTIFIGSEADRVERVGQSVPPPVVEALTRANHPEYAI